LTALDTAARGHERIQSVLQVAAVFLLSSLAVYDLVGAWMLNRPQLALPLVLGFVGLLVLGVALFVGLAMAGVC
jgi:hypothetical protein